MQKCTYRSNGYFEEFLENHTLVSSNVFKWYRLLLYYFLFSALPKNYYYIFYLLNLPLPYKMEHIPKIQQLSFNLLTLLTCSGSKDGLISDYIISAFLYGAEISLARHTRWRIALTTLLPWVHKVPRMCSIYLYKSTSKPINIVGACKFSIRSQI